jgi:hypothetical protein
MFFNKPEPNFVDGVSYIDVFRASHNEETGAVSVASYDNKPQRKVLINGRYIMKNAGLYPVFWSPEVKAWVYFDMDSRGGRSGRFDHLNHRRIEHHGKVYETCPDELYIKIEDLLENNILGYTYDIGIDPNDGRPAFIFSGWDDIDNGLPQLAMKLGIAPDQSAEDILWSMGFSNNIHFTDDSAKCIECEKIVYTADGSYEGRFEEISSEGYVCSECVHKDKGTRMSLVDDRINEPHKATTLLTDEELEEPGFTKIDEEYENGWYGVEDDPEVIMKHLREKWGDVLFQVTGCNPFDIGFVAWVRDSKEAVTT